MKYLIGFVGLIASLAIGNEFPDIYQNTNLLLHRSIVNHGDGYGGA